MIMDRQSQIDYLLDLYQNPTHKAPMDDADVSLQGGNPGCGDIVTYHIKVGPDGRLAAISFEGEGCTISQAAAISRNATNALFVACNEVSSGIVKSVPRGSFVCGTCQKRIASLSGDQSLRPMIPPRRRRRLAWLGVVLAAGLAVLLSFVFMRNTAPPHAPKFTKGKPSS